MNTSMNNVQDHIMANTWRLIFERHETYPTTKSARSLRTPDFSYIEETLLEYRLIGLEIAAIPKKRYQ